MKINSRLPILGSLVLGYLALLMPGTYVQYQAVADAARQSASSPLTSEGFVSVFSFQEVSAALPCQFGWMDWQSDIQHSGFLVWQLAGICLSMWPLQYWLRYAQQHKTPIHLFGALVIVLALGPVLWLLVFNHMPEPMCEPIKHFKMLTFSPYWVTVVLWVGSIGLGYWATRRINQPSNHTVSQSA